MKNLFIFSLGAITGGVIAWKLTEKKYKDIADEEIQSVKDVFKKRYEKHNLQNNDDDIKELISNYKSDVIIDDVNEDDCTIDIEEGSDEKDIHYIDSSEFTNIEEYDNETLIQYSNDVIADEYDNVLTSDDISEKLGSLTPIIFDDSDSAYIRNNVDKIDYEILRSEKIFIFKEKEETDD